LGPLPQSVRVFGMWIILDPIWVIVFCFGPRGAPWRGPEAERWHLKVARGREVAPGGGQSARLFGINVIFDPILVSRFHWFLITVL